MSKVSSRSNLLTRMMIANRIVRPRITYIIGCCGKYIIHSILQLDQVIWLDIYLSIRHVMDSCCLLNVKHVAL